MKPQDLWVPSQKGRLADWPQRQRATAGLLAGISNSAPRESMSLKGPSMTRGPLGRIRMVTSGIGDPCSGGCRLLSTRYFGRWSGGGVVAGEASGVKTKSTFKLLALLSGLASALATGLRCDMG